MTSVEAFVYRLHRQARRDQALRAFGRASLALLPALCALALGLRAMEEPFPPLLLLLAGGACSAAALRAMQRVKIDQVVTAADRAFKLEERLVTSWEILRTDNPSSLARAQLRETERLLPRLTAAQGKARRPGEIYPAAAAALLLAIILALPAPIPVQASEPANPALREEMLRAEALLQDLLQEPGAARLPATALLPLLAQAKKNPEKTEPFLRALQQALREMRDAARTLPSGEERRRLLAAVRGLEGSGKGIASLAGDPDALRTWEGSDRIEAKLGSGGGPSGASEVPPAPRPDLESVKDWRGETFLPQAVGRYPRPELNPKYSRVIRSFLEE